MAKMNEIERIALVGKITATLDVVVGHTLKDPEDNGKIGMYLLGAYTILDMLGIVTDEEYDALCEEAITMGD